MNNSTQIIEMLKISPYKNPVINLAIMLCKFEVPIVQNIFERLKFNELDSQDKKHILQAVSKHMLIHKLDELNIKTLTNLIHDPSWEVVKAVGFCDEASRGSPLFNSSKFWEKIKSAENKVNNLGSGPDELKNRIKKYIDGNKLIKEFPLFEKQKNKPFIRVVMDMTRDYLIDQFNQNLDPSDAEVNRVVRGFVKNLNLL